MLLGSPRNPRVPVSRVGSGRTGDQLVPATDKSPSTIDNNSPFVRSSGRFCWYAKLGEIQIREAALVAPMDTFGGPTDISNGAPTPLRNSSRETREARMRRDPMLASELDGLQRRPSWEKVHWVGTTARFEASLL